MEDSQFITQGAGKGSLMECKHCHNEIRNFEIHEVYLKSFDDVQSVDELYSNHSYFMVTEFYCPECKGALDKDDIVSYCRGIHGEDWYEDYED